MPSIHCREADLARLGLKLTPDGTGLAPVSPAAAQSGDEAPDTTWEAERLIACAKQRLTESFSAECDATRLRFRAGYAFALARDKFKAEREWIAHLRECGITPRHAWECIKLYEHFPSEEEAAKYRITEALVRAGAVKPKKKRPSVHDPPEITESTEESPFNDEEPPPPESPDSVCLALVRITDRLEFIYEKLAEVPKDEIPVEHVDRALEILARIREHAGESAVGRDQPLRPG
jgi:hypothetical protein